MARVPAGPQTTSASSLSADGDWTFYVGRDFRRWRDAADLSAFIVARTDERRSALPSCPTGQEQVGELEHVVRMQVREEHPRDRAERDAGLRKPQRRPAAAVEQEALPAGLHEGARPVLLQVDRRPHAGAEQDDLEGVGRPRRRRR